MKNKGKIILAFVLGVIITGSAVYASGILASNIGYKNGTVQDALDELYQASDNKVCLYLSGNKGQVGAKYACNPGDGIIRNFFILKIDNDDVKLIMEKNIDVNIDYYTALNYFTTGNGVSTKNSWVNVLDVDLPDAQDVVDASLIINPKQGWSFNISEESGTWWCLGSHVQDQPNGPDYCPTSLAQQNISWLFNYTYECTSRGCNNTETNNGYWTKSEVYDNNLNAWFVNSYGTLRSRPKNNYEYDGIRPVITLSKSSLAG